MRLKILLNDDDLFFRFGIEAVLRELALDDFSLQLEIQYEYNSENIKGADLIILSLSPGEHFLCTPELKKFSGEFIGIAELAVMPGLNITSCLKEGRFISRSASVITVRKTLSDSLRVILLGKNFIRERCCPSCNKKNISLRQWDIIERLARGVSVRIIAKQLNISEKNILTQKYIIMSRFNLKGNYDLITFVNNLNSQKNKSTSGYVFKNLTINQCET